MKNRVKLLCIKKGIETPEAFALAVGIGNLKAKAIWNESCVIEYSLIERLVGFFGCSAEYLLALCEKEA